MYLCWSHVENVHKINVNLCQIQLFLSMNLRIDSHSWAAQVSTNIFRFDGWEQKDYTSNVITRTVKRYETHKAIRCRRQFKMIIQFDDDDPKVASEQWWVEQWRAMRLGLLIVVSFFSSTATVVSRSSKKAHKMKSLKLHSNAQMISINVSFAVLSKKKSQYGEEALSLASNPMPINYEMIIFPNISVSLISIRPEQQLQQ